jgi:hypothetical protein
VRRLGLVGLALLALAAAGCSSGSASLPTSTTLGGMPNTHLTAVEEAASWFRAVNAKNRTASLAHFAPQARDQGNWDGGDVSQWPTFSNVKCSPISSSSTTANVNCTFHSHGGDGSSGGDTFWGVELHRTPGGPWLIVNYGQG